jgi:hypothetical protein
MANTYLARWPSTCARCLQRFPKGEQIAALTGSGAVHARCHPELADGFEAARARKRLRAVAEVRISSVDSQAAAVGALHKEIQARDLGRGGERRPGERR